MLSADERADINRANALKSTGPRTDAGKKRSAMNALRHGLTGQIVVMPEEDLKAYNAFQQSFHDYLKPEGPVESQLVQVVADSSWKMNRCKAWQDQILCTQQLLETEAEIADSENEANPELTSAIEIAKVVARISKDLVNFSTYEQRNFNMMRKAQQDLKTIQQERTQQRCENLVLAQDLLAAHDGEEAKKKAASEGRPSSPPYVPVPYDPAADGFDFSLDVLKTSIDRRKRFHAGRRL